MILTSSSFKMMNTNPFLQAEESSSHFDFTLFDSPGFSPTGLAWQGGSSAYLWNCDNESKKIYKIVPSDGNMIDKYESPGPSPMGLTWDGHYLWNVDNQEDKLYKIDPTTGSDIDNFQTPGDESTGLTFDGQYLWLADKQDKTIYKIDTQNGNVIHQFDTPGEYPTGLAWDGQYLWNADYQEKMIYMIQPDDGSIIYEHDIYWNNNPWGITWHDTYLWIADNDINRIFEIVINVSGNEPPCANFSWTPKAPEPGEWIYFNYSTCFDPDGTIIHYLWDFNNDGEYDAIDDINPYPKKWETPGSYEVTLTIVDNGTPFFTDSITKMINIFEKNPPTVQIDTPIEGDWVDGSVQIKGTANDPDGTIKKVDIKIDNGSWTTAIGTNQWSHSWHTTLLNVNDGPHTIYARSYNGVSYSLESMVTVILDNCKPNFVIHDIRGIATLSIAIKNIGNDDAENVTCTIDVFGGYFGLIHAEMTTTISKIAIGCIQKVTLNKSIIGFGPLDIAIEIQADDTNISIHNEQAYVFGVFII
jgi:hypothetical protein